MEGEKHINTDTESDDEDDGKTIIFDTEEAKNEDDKKWDSMYSSLLLMTNKPVYNQKDQQSRLFYKFISQQIALYNKKKLNQQRIIALEKIPWWNWLMRDKNKNKNFESYYLTVVTFIKKYNRMPHAKEDGDAHEKYYFLLKNIDIYAKDKQKKIKSLGQFIDRSISFSYLYPQVYDFIKNQKRTITKNDIHIYKIYEKLKAGYETYTNSEKANLLKLVMDIEKIEFEEKFMLVKKFYLENARLPNQSEILYYECENFRNNFDKYSQEQKILLSSIDIFPKNEKIVKKQKTSVFDNDDEKCACQRFKKEPLFTNNSNKLSRNDYIDTERKCVLTNININCLVKEGKIKQLEDCNEQEKTDRYNAILLTSDLHELFRNYLISFCGKKLIYREDIPEVGNYIRKIVNNFEVNFDERTTAYLDWHYIKYKSFE